jgi:hypothetical protein
MRMRNVLQGKIGEDAAALLGAMLVSTVSLAALSRADAPEHTRRDFYLYADEFQNYTTLSLASMLSELRKYRLNRRPCLLRSQLRSSSPSSQASY